MSSLLPDDDDDPQELKIRQDIVQHLRYNEKTAEKALEIMRAHIGTLDEEFRMNMLELAVNSGGREPVVRYLLTDGGVTLTALKRGMYLQKATANGDLETAATLALVGDRQKQPDVGDDGFVSLLAIHFRNPDRLDDVTAAVAARLPDATGDAARNLRRARADIFSAVADQCNVGACAVLSRMMDDDMEFSDPVQLGWAYYRIYAEGVCRPGLFGALFNDAEDFLVFNYRLFNLAARAGADVMSMALPYLIDGIPQAPYGTLVRYLLDNDAYHAGIDKNVAAALKRLPSEDARDLEECHNGARTRFCARMRADYDAHYRDNIDLETLCGKHGDSGYMVLHLALFGGRITEALEKLSPADRTVFRDRMIVDAAAQRLEFGIQLAAATGHIDDLLAPKIWAGDRDIARLLLKAATPEQRRDMKLDGVAAAFNRHALLHIRKPSLKIQPPRGPQ